MIYICYINNQLIIYKMEEILKDLQMTQEANKKMRIALERIASVYDWHEDLAGIISHEVLIELGESTYENNH